jgi:hypothetical protein
MSTGRHHIKHGTPRVITKTRRSPAFAQYWRYRGHAVQDRIGCYRRRQHLRRCNHQVSQGRGPCGRLLMARPAVLGCIWACGVKRRARAHAIMARVSRSEAARSLSRRSRPPSVRVHSSSNCAIWISSKRDRQACLQYAIKIGWAARVSQFPGNDPTTSRHTCACASVSSDGGAGGVCRDVSTMSVDVSAEDLRPRCLMPHYIKIVDV